MKRIITADADGKTIELTTCWLKEEEAAAVLGISASSFRRVHRDAPYSRVTPNTKRYDCEELDAYIRAQKERGEDDRPEPLPSPSRRRREMVIIDPQDQKVYRPKQETRGDRSGRRSK